MSATTFETLPSRNVLTEIFGRSYPESSISATLPIPHGVSTPNPYPKVPQPKVTIVNPLPGSIHTRVKLSRARKIAAKGVAVLDEVRLTLRFHDKVNSIERIISAENIMIANARGYDLATRIGLVTREQARHIPIAMYDKAIGAGRQRRKGGAAGA